MTFFRVNIILVTLSLALLSHCKEEEFAGSSGSGNSRNGDGKKKKPQTPSNKTPTDPNTGIGTDDLDTDDGNKEISKLKKPKFALMATDLRCGMCHLTINGDLSTVGSVKSFEPDSSIPAPGSDDHIASPYVVGKYDEKINGAWFIQGTYPGDRSRSQMSLKTTGGIKENYKGEEIPAGGFPKLDMAKAEKVAKGTLEGKDNNSKDVKINGIATTNVVLDGSKGAIVINGEVLVKGDVVIYGKYSGRGTIYASGNIYIAGDITATNSAFPFPDDKTAAMTKGKAQAEAGQLDALGLVSNSSIIFGDPNHQTVTGTPHSATPPVAPNNIFKWFPGYSGLYAGKVGKGIKSRWDAFLYASHMIAGKTGLYVLNGGMICDSFHILGAPDHFLGVPTTLGYRNVINYDYRMANGLKILEAFDDAF